MSLYWEERTCSERCCYGIVCDGICVQYKVSDPALSIVPGQLAPLFLNVDQNSFKGYVLSKPTV